MEGNIRSIFLLALGMVVIRQSLCLTKPTSVKLEDNGYTGVVFAIHYDEPECDKLIEELKEMITSASAHLYKATKHRAYFKEVTILIPDTWEDKEEYQSPRNATFDGADVIIATGNPRYSQGPGLPSVPYTKHYEGCGKRAVYIHFTSRFLLSDEVERHYGEKGRILVHEWGHYRWGLFDEYPDQSNMDQFYYSFFDERWEPTRCTRGINGENLVFNNNTNSFRTCNGNPLDGYEVGCVNMPSLAQPDNVTASLMSHYANIQKVVDFCDDENHNDDAPNKHNRLCDGRSAWNVMREHEDFRDDNNPPREIDDVTPRIILARTRKIRYVLVLDSSGSMGGNNRIEKLSTASQNFILKIAREGSYVGIVDFDSIATIVSGLTYIGPENEREDLARRIPTTANGGTCIGNGLQRAFEILSADGQSPAGGKVIVITDGEDGCDDTTIMAGMQLIDAGVVINAITFGPAADPELLNLADLSGGKQYHQGDEDDSTGLRAAFIEIGGAGVREQDRRIEIFRDSSSFSPSESRDYFVFIDETVGNKTTFEFSYIQESASPAISVTVYPPDDGPPYDNRSAGYSVNTEFKVVSVNIETAQAGSWRFTVQNTLAITLLAVFSNVYTHPSQHGVDPITATSELSGLRTNLANGDYLTVYAEVRQGFFPLIEADVRASIQTPTGSTVSVKLVDDGSDPDETKDDGIYSGVFTGYTGLGYYGIGLIINSNENTRVLDGGNTPLPYSCTLPSVDPLELLKGNIPTIGGVPILIPGMPLPEIRGSPAPIFTRVVSGGSSQVTETPVNWNPGDDIFAPSRIFDLSVASTSYDNGTVTLEFTAPGDDLNSGNASYYVIRMSSSPAELQNNYNSTPPIDETDIRYGDTSSPGNAGVRERFVLSVDVPPGQHVVSYVFAMHAVDDVGNEGKMSNLVQATLRLFIPPPPPPPPTTEEVTTEAQKTTTPATVTPSSASPRTEAPSTEESSTPTSPRTEAPSSPTLEEIISKPTPAMNGSRALAITLPVVVVSLIIFAVVLLVIRRALQKGGSKSANEKDIKVIAGEPDGIHDNTAFDASVNTYANV